MRKGDFREGQETKEQRNEMEGEREEKQKGGGR